MGSKEEAALVKLICPWCKWLETGANARKETPEVAARWLGAFMDHILRFHPQG